MLSYIAFLVFCVFTVAAIEYIISSDEETKKTFGMNADYNFNYKDFNQSIGTTDDPTKLAQTVSKRATKKTTHYFTNFFLNLLKIINNFVDDDLIEFYDVTSKEIWEYNYEGCKFKELIYDDDFKLYIASKINDMKHKPAGTIRRDTAVFYYKIEKRTWSQEQADLIDAIDSVFTKDFEENFNLFLMKLNYFRNKAKSNMDLKEIIKQGLRKFIFDYYSNLDTEIRRQIKRKVRHYWIHEANRDKKKAIERITTITHHKEDKTTTIRHKTETKRHEESTTSRVLHINENKSQDTESQEENTTKSTRKSSQTKASKHAKKSREQTKTYNVLNSFELKDEIQHVTSTRTATTVNDNHRTVKSAEASEKHVLEQMNVDKTMKLKYDLNASETNDLFYKYIRKQPTILRQAMLL